MAKKKVHNIVRLERGATPTDYLGMLQIATTVNKGRYIPNFDEGNPYPHVTDSGNAQAADNVGTQGQFPVATTVTSENVATALSLLTATTEVMKVLGKASGGQNNELLTFSNHFFDRLSMRFSRGQDAQIVLRGSCFSDDGSTFPLSSADSADTTAPSASKTKTNNIVSVAHGSVPSPGITDVAFEVVRSIPQPDHDEGELYPIGVDFIGLSPSQYPVTITIGSEDVTALSAFLSDGMEDLVVTLKAAGGASNPVITAQNAQFGGARGGISRRKDGTFSLSGFAVCDVGSASTLPIAIA